MSDTDRFWSCGCLGVDLVPPLDALYLIMFAGRKRAALFTDKIVRLPWRRSPGLAFTSNPPGPVTHLEADVVEFLVVESVG